MVILSREDTLEGEAALHWGRFHEPAVFFSRGRACAKLVTHVSVNKSEHHLRCLACKEEKKLKNTMQVRKAFPKR